MSHTDPAILALRALGEHNGSAQDDAHTAQCADCQLELERLSRVVGLARSNGPVVLEQPPPSVWERIAAATGEDTMQPDMVQPGAMQPDTAPPGANGSGPAHDNPDSDLDSDLDSDPDGSPQAGGERPHRSQRPRRGRGMRRGRGRLAVVVAGLAAGLIIGIGGTVAVTQLTQAPTNQVVAEIALRPLAQFPQWQSAAGTAVLRGSSAAQQLAVTVSAPRRSGFYEVWLLGQDGTSMISLGDLNTADTGTFTLPGGVDLRFYSRIDVSLQPFNGSTLHSSTSVVRGFLPAETAGTAGAAGASGTDGRT